ncbi:MAG TPA: VTT domain-containing protein [Anaerolineae bacterium]|nr:VTT domain-containing protein [Anaerolineae bacterium]
MDFLLHPDRYLEALGPIGMFVSIAIIFAESGLFFGFFLPGDSLLLTCGLLAFKGIFNVWILLIGFPIAAILGDNVGYWFGNKVGPPIFSRPESRFFKPQNLAKAKEFYDRHGPITIVLARFLPFIRTFAPIVAGAVSMRYRTFFFYNVIGGILWGTGVTLVGYFLASVIPPETLDRYFILIALAAFIIPGLPTVFHLWNENREKILARVRRQPEA